MPANTDPTSTNTSATDGVVGTVAGWFSHLIYGTPTAGQLQATSASLDNQLANGTNQTTLNATIAGAAPATILPAAPGDGTYQGNDNAYAPGGSVYNTIVTTQGPDAANAAWAQVQANLAAQEQQTAAIPGQIGESAIAGAQNGLNSLYKWFKKLPGALVLGIGWQWWLLAIAVLFFWMGGLSWLKGILKKTK